MSEKQPLLSPRFEKALVYANRLHACDKRKGTSVPYVAHLLGVCALVLSDGGSEEEAVAALLHDALEDHPNETSREEIGKRFGARVLSIVEDCTDTPPDYKGGDKPPWRQRKESYVEHIRSSDSRSHRVALADKLNNITSTIVDYRRHGESVWERFNAGKEDQVWLYRTLVEAFREAGVKGPMFDEFAKVVKELDRMAGSA